MKTENIIKELRRIMIDNHRCLGCGHEHSCSTRGCAIMRNAAERLEAQQARIRELEEQRRWIPVGERPPEEITNRVNVLCKNGYRGFGHYEDRNGKRTWYNLENDRPFTDWDPDDYEVTHWMPLPELPKEAANESDT